MIWLLGVITLRTGSCFNAHEDATLTSTTIHVMDSDDDALIDGIAEV